MRFVLLPHCDLPEWDSSAPGRFSPLKKEVNGLRAQEISNSAHPEIPKNFLT